MKYLLIVGLVLLGGCNFVSIKPETIDKNQTFYTERGGYSMKHHIKDVLENRNYKVLVGKQKSSSEFNLSGTDSDSVQMGITDIIGARYIVQVSERSESFAPFWCVFNGVWWWRFNVSISDNNTGQELLNWTGRGCRNSSLRKLDKYLEKLEKSGAN